MRRRSSLDPSSGHTLEHWPPRDASSGHTLAHWRGRKRRRRRGGPRPQPTNLNGVLDEIAAKCDGDSAPGLTLAEILDSVGRRSYGPLLLVIGLFAISPVTAVPGLTWFAAALTLLVAGQMALGLPRIWLPRQALQAKLPREAVRAGIAKSRSAARAIDGLLRPRLVFLTKPPFVNLVAVLCIGAALITFPLGFIPLAPLAPGLAVVFFGLGMVARDGLWLGLGTLAVAGAFWLAIPRIF